MCVAFCGDEAIGDSDDVLMELRCDGLVVSLSRMRNLKLRDFINYSVRRERQRKSQCPGIQKLMEYTFLDPRGFVVSSLIDPRSFSSLFREKSTL